MQKIEMNRDEIETKSLLNIVSHNQITLGWPSYDLPSRLFRQLAPLPSPCAIEKKMP
jgi:hypothetical protein